MAGKDSAVLWVARALAFGMCAFLALFALDAWSPDKPIARAAADILIHLTPAALVLGVILASWHREWIGGFAFIALAIAYAAMVRFRLDWVVAISGPLLTIGLLYLWSWWANSAQLPTSATR